MSDQSAGAKTRTLAIAGLLITVIALAGCGTADGGDPADSGPAGVIETYRVAYNDGDIEQVMALFSEESELTLHPLASDSAGLVTIRGIQLRDMGAAADTDAYSFSNVETSGSTVTWDSAWTNSDGSDWCADGHSAVIADGRILSWSFAADRYPCARS